MPNPYAADLERELVHLRSRRVAIRNKLQMVTNGFRIAGDTRDPSELRNVFATELKAIDREWQRLHYELGRSLPGPAIKLDVPTTPPRRTARPASATRTVSGYMTKVMVPGR